MQTESVALAELVLDPANARKHATKNLEAIKGSLARFGQQKPIVVGKNNVVIAGNGTLEAARSLGWDKINVVRTELEGPEATAFAIADNRTGELAEWDAGVLGDTLKALQAIDFDLGAIGFDDKDLAAMIATPEGGTEGLTDPDSVPEDVETRCKPGDLWVLGKHRLLCGDSTNVQHVERLMGGERADMVFTDPPYNVAVVGGCKNPLNPMYQSGKSIQNDKMDDDSFRQFLRDFYTSAYLATKPGGPIYVCHADSEGINFRSAMIETGWLLKQCLIWAKSAFVFGRQDYHWQHEPILYGWKDGAGHEFYGERNQSTIWNFNRPGPSDKEHPTMKPVDLVEKGVANSSKPGDLVLDPFLGSGTTLVASEKTGRRCFGMEVDAKYCDVILARWEKFTGLTASLVTEA